MSLRDIAPHLADSLDSYARHGQPTGGFLRACLENDLMEACGRADTFNKVILHVIASYIYNELPANCHGSRERVESWLATMAEQRDNAPA